MPAVVGIAVFVLGVILFLSLVDGLIAIVCLETIVPYGISLAISGGVYYLFDKHILSKKKRINKKDHPFLWSLLLSIILFYPIHILVDEVMYLILFKLLL